MARPDEQLEATAEEQRAIDALQRLARRWPGTLYLASMAGVLCVMRKDEDGGHAMEPDGTSLDQTYVLDTVRIDNTGGDW